jgi:hypothetical protein
MSDDSTRFGSPGAGATSASGSLQAVLIPYFFIYLTFCLTKLALPCHRVPALRRAQLRRLQHFPATYLYMPATKTTLMTPHDMTCLQQNSLTAL